ncbi:DinB family protein [Arthrobacter sp. FW306-07-I]|uniref:DinB family protein n=1 Tax=Arthrobacter sp. FW306-07-I TaxID=2879622 RepID=UPI001F29C39C|nr:DinB family protein [Arthrobacter sp. FW306-07-I]UKA76148.1 DinB family protein [Arthrobacter sp. FW306-07-I]
MEPNKADIMAEYGRARADLDHWLESATADDLSRRSNGTKWTNEELLFHMVFGYMVVRALLPLIHVISRLPKPVGAAFAALLNSGTRPFDVINYWGSRAAAMVYNKRRMGRKLDTTLLAITRRLEHESPASLSRSMPFPDRWDPFFKPLMTLTDVYAYPTNHFDFHARQLSIRRHQQ